MAKEDRPSPHPSLNPASTNNPQQLHSALETLCALHPRFPIFKSLPFRQNRPVQIELILSKIASLCLKQQPSRPMTDSPGHFLAQWRVETAEDHCREQFYIVTNCATLFTFLLPRTRAMRWLDLATAFRTRLRFALLAASPPAEIAISEIIPVKGNLRKVVGSMNEMCYLLSQGCTDPPTADPEGQLNHTPFSAIDTKTHFGFPDLVWQAKLNELGPIP